MERDEEELILRVVDVLGELVKEKLVDITVVPGAELIGVVDITGGSMLEPSGVVNVRLMSGLAELSGVVFNVAPMVSRIELSEVVEAIIKLAKSDVIEKLLE